MIARAVGEAGRLTLQAARVSRTSYLDEPDFDSDCTLHGVATWSIHGGHEVVHYCDDRCPTDCGLGGVETGEWCSGPLEMRTDVPTLASRTLTAG